MPKVTAPLLSLEAKGSIAGVLTYQKRPSGAAVYIKNKPGDVSGYNPSATQHDQRGLMGIIVAAWKAMTPAAKTVYENLAEATGEPLTGYHYFVREAVKNPLVHVGLCLYFGLNSSGGTTVVDVSKNGNTGTLVPTPPTNGPQAVESYKPKYGKARQFNGVTDYVSIPNVPLLNFVGTSNFTICAWIKPTSQVVKTNTIFAKYSSTRGYMFAVNITSSKKLFFIVRDSAGDSSSISSATAITNNKWTHVAATFAAGAVKIYINQVLDKTGTLTKTLANDTAEERVGAGVGSTNYRFLGDIDELQVYNRVLGLSEIQEKSSMSAPEKPLEAEIALE